MYVALLLSGELKSYFKKKKNGLKWSIDYSTEAFTPINAAWRHKIKAISRELYIKIPAVIHWFYVPQVILTNCALKSLKLTSS